jgi:hypothetical protein
MQRGNGMLASKKDSEKGFGNPWGWIDFSAHVTRAKSKRGGIMANLIFTFSGWRVCLTLQYRPDLPLA